MADVVDLTATATAVAQTRNALVCFSHLRWDFVYQRPQHLLSRATKTYDVHFIEEPVYQDAVVPHLTRAVSGSGVAVHKPMLPTGLSEDQIIAVQESLIASLVQEIGPFVAWYYTPMAMAFTRHLSPLTTVYDNMDELSAFRGASPNLMKLEEELFGRADVVFTGGYSLYSAKCHRHHNIHPIPSSIDAKHFLSARERVRTRAEHRDVSKAVVGFFGVIDERMDLALVDGLGSLRPDWDVRMIGPIAKIDPSALPLRANVRWLGGCPYADLPRYLAEWDVGIMPFAINDSTRYISPTKTPEFLAAGLPVVSTRIADVVNPYGVLGLTEIADTPRQFVDAIERLMRRPTEDWFARIDAFLETTSWDQTWEKMDALLSLTGHNQSFLKLKGTARV